MRGLTLQQPWATLVAFGYKQLETRSWRTPYRGPLVIHSSAEFPAWCQQLVSVDPFKAVLQEIAAQHGAGSVPMPLGAALAVCQLADVYRIGPELCSRLDRVEYSFGDYTHGRFAFALRNVVRLRTPMPMKGALSLWTIPNETAVRVLHAAGLN
jgi:hypothetical protein